jgi:FKBP-type peptidyl-prolyl cis-trans isomerase
MKSAILLIQLSAIVGPTATFAWTTPNTSDCRCTTRCFATVSRRTLFESSLVAPVAAVVSAAAISTAAPQSALAAGAATTLPNGVSYVVLKSAKPIKGMSAEEEELLKPVVGELIAIRFAAYANGIKIDDIYDNPEPYYTRLGSGGLIAGVEQTLPLMKLGDRWELTIPVRSSCLYMYTYVCKSAWTERD